MATFTRNANVTDQSARFCLSILSLKYVSFFSLELGQGKKARKKYGSALTQRNTWHAVLILLKVPA